MLPEQALVLRSDTPNFPSVTSVLQPLGRMSLCRKYFQAAVYAASLGCKPFQVVSGPVLDR